MCCEARIQAPAGWGYTELEKEEGLRVNGNSLAIKLLLGLQAATFAVIQFHCPAFTEPMSTAILGKVLKGRKNS